ncbi:MAG: type II toxin-antitoxin system PemK/MazF family toxin [Betaproteobacteria bacterium]|nr:type II toxin-antitoxin system PemK/MazF family toxin [Betaproteobacteria bacterium]
MKRGEIWVGNLNPSRGKENGKIRPVLVVQANELTPEVTPMVVVLPLTTQVYPGFNRWRISIPARERLLKPCQVVADQPRALDRSRLGEGPLASLTGEEMAAVEKSLRAVMGML